MKIQDVMTRQVASVRPRGSIADAAKLMQERGVGILPVVENGHLHGMITDRDIAVGCDARGRDSHRLTVAKLMTRDVRCCHEDDDVDKVLTMMAREHLRRIPVLLHHKFPRIVGIVSIDDLADVADNTGLFKEILDTRAKATASP